MERIVNMKFVRVLTLMLAMLFAIAIVPTSANAAVVAEDGATIEYLGELDDSVARGITRFTGRGFAVYPAFYDAGVMTYYEDLGQTFEKTGYTPYNLTVPSDVLLDATTYNCDYLMIELYFSVEGTGSMRLEFKSDNDLIITGNIPQQGYYKIQWHTPIKYSTYGLTVYGTGSTSLHLGGHISV